MEKQIRYNIVHLSGTHNNCDRFVLLWRHVMITSLNEIDFAVVFYLLGPRHGTRPLLGESVIR